jgi:hypothetical protein
MRANISSYSDWLAYALLFSACYYLFFGIGLLFLCRVLPPHLPITTGHFFHWQAYHPPHLATTLLSSLNRWLALLLLPS